MRRFPHRASAPLFFMKRAPTLRSVWIRTCAPVLRHALRTLDMKHFPRTSGSKGVHLYVPNVHRPVHEAVWTFASVPAVALALRHLKLITTEYRVAKRPRGRVGVDYKQNRWGSTLAGVCPARPRPHVTVSTPLRREKIAGRATTEHFRFDNVPAGVRVERDLWMPLLLARGRTDVDTLLSGRRGA